MRIVGLVAALACFGSPLAPEAIAALVTQSRIEATYDPLALPDVTAASAAEDEQRDVLELVVHDLERERDVPVLVHLPAPGATRTAATPAPVVLFSHGLGGSRHGSAYLGRHWAARGYVCVFLQHPGSDDAIWKDVPLLQRLGAFKREASLENYLLRVADVPAVLDQLEAWNAERGHPLAGLLDLEHVGMSGHSFGAVTTQALSGQTSWGGRVTSTDPRVDAALPMSPSIPRLGDPESAFGSVEIPWLLMTGTHDLAMVGSATIESRLAVYPALPPGRKYELVLDRAEHSAFTESALPGDSQPRNPNHHRVILALSTAFWDASLRGDEDARAWLDGEGPRTVLEDADRWQHK